MISLRAFTVEDIPAVAALRRRAFAHSRWESAQGLERYMRRVFFENPWIDPELPSFVSAAADGAINGFIGIVPRPMALGGKQIRGAVATQFMVAPENRGVTGVQLLMRAFRGAQDLLFTDVVTTPARRLWENRGASAAPLFEFRWTHPLRPARFATSRLRGGAIRRAVRAGGTRVLEATEVFSKRIRNYPAPSTVPLDAERVVATLKELPARMLVPVYTAESFRWLLLAVQEKWPGARVQPALVSGEQNQTIGWFIYVTHDDGTAQVMHLAALPGQEKAVLQNLFNHADRSGAAAVTGRLDPMMLDALGALGCSFAREGNGVLVHAKNQALLTPILRGEALFGGLEGEWWMDF